jgi:hypothetical protein
VSVFTATTVWPSALTAIGPDLGAFPGAGAGGAVSVGVAVGTLVAVAVGATTTWLRSATQRNAGRRLLPSGHCGIGPRGDVRRSAEEAAAAEAAQRHVARSSGGGRGHARRAHAVERTQEPKRVGADGSRTPLATPSSVRQDESGNMRE